MFYLTTQWPSPHGRTDHTGGGERERALLEITTPGAENARERSSPLPSFRTSEARSRRPRCLEEDTPVSSFVFHDTIEGPRASAVRGVSLQLQLPMPLPQLPRPHGLFPLPFPPPLCRDSASPFISRATSFSPKLSVSLSASRAESDDFIKTFYGGIYNYQFY